MFLQCQMCMAKLADDVGMCACTYVNLTKTWQPDAGKSSHEHSNADSLKPKVGGHYGHRIAKVPITFVLGLSAFFVSGRLCSSSATVL